VALPDAAADAEGAVVAGEARLKADGNLVEVQRTEGVMVIHQGPAVVVTKIIGGRNPKVAERSGWAGLIQSPRSRM
jgi:hypothetical protein